MATRFTGRSTQRRHFTKMEDAKRWAGDAGEGRGIRTTELKRISWTDVHLADAEPFVHISPGHAKKRSVRNIPIPANAIKGLDLVTHDRQLVRNVSRNDFQRHFQAIARCADMKANEPPEECDCDFADVRDGQFEACHGWEYLRGNKELRRPPDKLTDMPRTAFRKTA